MSLLDDIAGRRGFYYQTSFDDDADSEFVMKMRNDELDMLVEAVREYAELVASGDCGFSRRSVALVKLMGA